MEPLNKSLFILSSVVFFYFIDFILIKHFDKNRKDGSGRSWDFTFFIFTVVSILVLQPISLYWLSFEVRKEISYLGVLLIIASLGLHIWARKHLGHFYAERVEVQQKHDVINTGPYKLIRHPVITSFFGISFGMFLINPSIVTIGAFLYTLWDFAGAAKAEEILLSKELVGYKEYMKQTSKFLPLIW